MSCEENLTVSVFLLEARSSWLGVCSRLPKTNEAQIVNS